MPKPKKKTNTPVKRSPKTSDFRVTLGGVFSNKKAVFLSICAVLILFSFFIFILRDLPSPISLGKDVFPVSTKILDRNGKLLYEIYSDHNRTPIKLKDLPDYVSQATIAVEDKNFFTHHGFDTQGIIRAAWRTLTGERLEGGSTITQQLIKVALLTPERTIERKLKEAFLAFATEILYTKPQILEMYLNHIPYGGTAYGIETASKVYFGKPASELSLAEAAILAGLPQAPTRYSPFSNPEAAKTRQAQVLSRMVEEKFITEEEAQNAKSKELIYAQSVTNIEAPHFVMYVRQILEEEYGVQRVEQGGLIVTTTLDLDLQKAAEASLSAEVNSLKKLRVSNGASLVTNPKTGEILAMIGSRNYFDTEIDGKVNVTTRLRQPGSSIKPLNYALGLETKVITPSSMLLDTPICFKVEGQPDYCPKNYDNSYHGAVQIRYALANSYNIPAVKVLALNDVINFISFARKMGINSWGDTANYGLSLTLGGGEVKMTEMATAFGTFANQGTKVPLQNILKIQTHTGKTLFEYKPGDVAEVVDRMSTLSPSDCSTNTSSCPLEKPLSPQVAFLISHILSDNSARSAAFGPNSVLNIRGHTVAVKTGTTNNLRDNWTIGYTDDTLVATWVGNNDNTPMSSVTSGVTGASPIWQDIMSYALRGKEQKTLTRPDGLEIATVCIDSGVLLVGESESGGQPGCAGRSEYFLEGTTPLISRISRREIWINKDTQLPPENESEFGNIELQSHLVASDPFTTDYCLDCAPTSTPAPEEGQAQDGEYPRTGQTTTLTYTPGSYTLNEK